jgi:hypothetical protein
MPVEEIVAGAVVVLVGGVGWAALAHERVRRRRVDRHARRRSWQAEQTAVEASLEDEAFAPEAIRSAVDGVLAFVSTVWSDDESVALGDRSDAGSVYRWARSRAKLLGGGTWVVGRPVIDLLRIVNRPGQSEDRAVVRVRLPIHRSRGHVHAYPLVRELDERWTFGRTQGRWELLSVGGDPLAPALLEGRQVPGEWADEDRLREQALGELADVETAGTRMVPADLVTGGSDARLQLLDLSNVDGRFTLALLGAAVGHLVDAWEEAATGSLEPLSRVASREACEQLLQPQGRASGMRMMLQDASLERWEPIAFDAKCEPPRVVVSVTVAAVRYVVSTASGEHLAGSTEFRRPIPLSWTLELSESHPVSWRLRASSNPAAEIPGIDP